MPQALIACHFTEDTVQFFATKNESALPVAAWCQHALYGASGAPFSYNTLGQLLNKGWANEDEYSIITPNQYLAQCQPWELSALLLPQPSPLHLRLRPKGSLTLGQNFTVEYGFYSLARPVRFSRTGILLKSEGKEYCLLDPTFSLVTKIEEYKKTPLLDADARMRWWGEVLALVPDPAIIDDNILRSYKIARADFFTVNIQSVRDGLRITPRLLAAPRQSDNEDREELDTDLVTAAAHSRFLKDFHKLPLRCKYALGDGYFLTLPQEIQSGLGVVKSLEYATLQEKIDFINNPYKALKESLAGIVPEHVIDSFFVETPIFLHERVKGLCIWEARNVFPTSSSGLPWLPDDLPDIVPLEIGKIWYQVTVPELKKFIADVVCALETNEECVFLQEKPIPVTLELLEKLKTIAQLFREKAEQEHPPGMRIAPKITDVEATEIATAVRPTWEGTVNYPNGTIPHTHQLAGIKWLQQHWRIRSDGALLADDMGLGKTLQTLSFMWWLRKQMEERHISKSPMLIIAPAAVIKNWQDEAIKFFGTELGTPVEAHGNFFLQHKWSRATAREILMAGDWAVTTYETMRDKIEVFTGPFSLLVFDEAQKIKNPGALVTHMAKSIKADICIALTGTPVENSLHDLVSIVDRVQPQRKQVFAKLVDEYERIDVGGQQSFAQYPKNIHAASDAYGRCMDNIEANEEKYDKNAVLQKIKNELECTGHPLLLRRIKETHWAERPQKKIYPPYEDEMPPVQADLYDTALAKAKEKLRMGSMGAILEAIQRMRQISLHPPLDPSDPPEKMLQCSARIHRLMSILDTIRERDEKALIFIEYLDSQARLAKLLNDKYHLGVNCINGGVSGGRRKEIVDIFQKNTHGFDLLLLSPKAGGVGLNLTAANHVIHLTRWWNPAVEDQCTDRAYRIGQTKPVFLYYPLAIHPKYKKQSFDCNLHRLLQKKRELSHNLLAPAEPGHRREDFVALLGDV